MRKQYHIGDVLSITTGRLVSNRHIEGVYDILGYMTGENLFTHQLPRASKQCLPFLLSQHPHLSDLDGSDLDALISVAGPAKSDQETAVREWLERQVRRFGEFLYVRPLPPGENCPRDPIQELEEMVGKDRLIVVEAPAVKS